MGQEPALLVARRAQRHERGVARIGRAQLVHIAHLGFHRAAGGLGQEVARVLVERGALTAEVAADERAVDDNAVFGHADGPRHLHTQVERRLVGGDDADGPIGLDPGRARVWLDVALVLTRRAERVLEDAVRPGKGCCPFPIASDRYDDLPLNVRMRHGRAGATEIGVLLGVLVQDRRGVCQRILGAGHHGQLFVVDLDELGGGFGRLARLGGDRGNTVADEQHFRAGQDRPVLNASAKAGVVRQVGTG